MMGLKGATSHYACVWCKTHKDNRWDTKFDIQYYQSPELKRTLEEMTQLALKKKQENKYCCERVTLHHIELDHVILDELHLLLRILCIELKIWFVMPWNGTKKKTGIRGKVIKKINILKLYSQQ